jgi:hypothetical protein
LKSPPEVKLLEVIDVTNVTLVGVTFVTLATPKSGVG